MDAVFFGQSWHWADPDSAGAEAARMLRRPGTLGLLWNADDDAVGWVSELQRLTGSSTKVTDFHGPPVAIEGFCPGHRRYVEWPLLLDRAALLELVSTTRR